MRSEEEQPVDPPPARELPLSAERPRSNDERDREFEAVVHAEWRVLVRLAQKLSATPDEVNDTLQEAVTRTYAAWRTGKVHELDRYLTVVVRNTAFGLRRRHRREALGLERLAAQDGTRRAKELEHPDDGRIGIRDEVRAALEKLTPGCREILELRVIDEWPVNDVAARLYIAPGTVKSRCHRCLKQLSRLLDA